MRRIANLLRKDILLGIKDIFILLEIGFSVVTVFLFLYLIPESFDTEATVFIYDESGVVEQFVSSTVPNHEDVMGEFYVDSRQELIDGMVENRSALGLEIRRSATGSPERYAVELLKQPYTTEAMAQFIEIDLEDLLSIIAPPAGVYPVDVYESVRVTALQSGLRDEIPFNQRIMPAVMLFMVGILGIFAMVSLVGQERGDQTIRAFKVSPASLWEFLASKNLTVLFTGMVTYSILYIPIFGLSGYLPGLAIIALSIVLGSGIGTILGSFIADPMASIGFIFLFMIVLGLPMVSLLAPVFSPGWLKAIPSYFTVYGLDAAMFPDDNTQVIWQSVGILAAWAAGLYILSGIVFTARARKEA